ncbi:MAG TPA: sugar ABC transporter ATP-binding protein [Anaeromyxobacter sp.]|nr:sugar ABC transporter ATP-binding protein [Anaeromyxobacter sp.]
MSAALVRAEGITKEFSSVPVLHDVTVEIRRGEILGIIGENGAGKSTFLKILAGIHPPTAGRLFLDGREIAIRTPLDAKRAGIVLIPQELNLVADLNVAENVFLGNELRRRGGLLDRRAMVARTAELLASLEVQVDPEEKIAALSVAQKQMVEIAKALAFDARLLVMDEPTTVLTRREIGLLFARMRALQARGVTLIYISHKLREVKEICDRVMVLRDGRLICLEEVAALEIDEMVRRMVGRELSQVFPPRRPGEAAVALRVEGLTVPGVIEDVSFELRRGEILGLAGLGGSGRTEVAEAIIGVRRTTRGRIEVEGRPVAIRGPHDAVRAGISYLSEDRQGSGILVSQELVKNVSLVSLARYLRAFLVERRRERTQAQHYVQLFSIRTPGLDERLEFLSGGNQQKVSLAKSIDTEPRILIADEPTRGIDVAAKRDIYRLLHELAARGVACLFISSELEELIGMCSRVLVMREGRVAGQVEGAAVTEEEIMSFAAGVKGEA